MPRKNSVTRAPYDQQGNLQHYPMNGWEYTGETETRTYGLAWGDRSGQTYEYQIIRDVPVDWRPNEPFQATLTLQELARGRSAAYFWWTDQDGHRYPMFMSDMVEVVKLATTVGGVVTDTWIVRKRGQNYGIGLYR